MGFKAIVYFRAALKGAANKQKNKRILESGMNPERFKPKRSYWYKINLI